MASASDEEDPVAPSSTNLFCKDAFVVIKPGYQPSRLQEAPFFLGKCKNDVKASERKLTVSIYAQGQLLPFNFVDAQLQCQIETSGILLEAENVRIEDDVVALDEDGYSSCVIDCLDYGDRTTIVSCDWRRCVRRGSPRDNSANHTVWTNTATPRSIIIPALRLTVKYPCLLMTLMSLWLINTKDKLLFDTSCTICATGLHRTHELTKCSGRQLTNKGTK